MKISLHNSPAACNAAAGETVLSACSRAGIILSAPCGGRQRCGKCAVRLLEGQVTGDTPDAEGRVRACAAVPVSDITIACCGDISGSVLTAENSLPGGLAANSAPARAAVALDIGTTTISARLIDIDTSQVLETVSQLNDQRAFGADVMSRIGAAQNGKTGELFALINRQTRRILASFQEQWNLQKIEQLAVSGNTVMLHLFLNVDPSGMGRAPFTPAFLEERELDGKSLSLPVGKITVLPSIAAFLGGDITAGLAVLDILSAAGPALFIDIGTNGEMALAHRGISCCSTAAGPAFEGAEISCGMGGVAGAVSGVELDAGATAGNAFSVTTIGNAPPSGICGSGLVDAVTVMLKLGIIDETGFMAGSEKGFTVAPGVSITGRDIRQFQLAKSAILSGIKILCKNSGLKLADIQNVFIAGGFGFFINKHNAVTAGIFPEEFRDSLVICGNLSLQGATDYLTVKDFPARCKRIIEQCSVIDLTRDPDFTDEFAENMGFSAGV